MTAYCYYIFTVELEDQLCFFTCDESATCKMFYPSSTIWAKFKHNMSQVFFVHKFIVVTWNLIRSFSTASKDDCLLAAEKSAVAYRPSNPNTCMGGCKIQNNDIWYIFHLSRSIDQFAMAMDDNYVIEDWKTYLDHLLSGRRGRKRSYL